MLQEDALPIPTKTPRKQAAAAVEEEGQVQEPGAHAAVEEAHRLQKAEALMNALIISPNTGISWTQIKLSIRRFGSTVELFNLRFTAKVQDMGLEVKDLREDHEVQMAVQRSMTGAEDEALKKAIADELALLRNAIEHFALS
ncbi:hypothetical protein EK21DRAFT_106679 [Setomelanomma holmii]|uniref:Uncharacterized protein n=1 Tax=Setomelanomma holmii TaxID=210430 RepID=A0A9P4HMA4_9PLEO|nr:hypothetical protein EK21DRAFT_106679 [Setomelanomma holmii]